MIGSNQYNLTWEHFEQLHEDKTTVFENLCRSLFLRELCSEGTILHSDPEHPGVEVEPVLAKDAKTYISFQAKYFGDRIGYVQIMKSVKETIAHYSGHLGKFYLYCNKDIKSTSSSYSAMERLLADAGMELILVTGQTILDQAASYPTILSRYFGLDRLDIAWFERNLKLSLDNLGRRYNSLFNIDTTAQKNLNLFLREPEGIAKINEKKLTFFENIGHLKWRISEEYRTFIVELTKAVKVIPDVSLETINDALKWENYLKETCNPIFEMLRKKQEELLREIEEAQNQGENGQTLRDELYGVEQLLAISDVLAFSKEEELYIEKRVLLVTGEMGTGKSQLLATAAKRLMQNHRAVLLLLGQIYISDETIENQIINGLEGLSTGESLESLIAAMDESSVNGSGDAVIFIDAINESARREIWKTGLNRLINLVEGYKNVRLVISLRSGFECLTLSDKLWDDQKNKKIAHIIHEGFFDDSPASIYEFLSNYGIIASPEYYLQSEMTNPLFLTWFCQTYTGKEQGVITLINRVIEQADLEGSKEAGYDEATGILRPLLYDFIETACRKVVTKQQLLQLSVWNTYGIVNKIVYIKAIERFGMLVSYIRDEMEVFYIGYNLLEDYLQACRIIENKLDKKEIKDYCKNQLLGIDDKGRITNYGNETVFAMVSALYAGKYGEECIDILDDMADGYEKYRLQDLYFLTFTWRSTHVTYEAFLKCVEEYGIKCRTVWKIFIENATKENSELNAMGLTRLLSGYELKDRDYLWTMEINELSDDERLINLVYFIEKGNRLNGLSERKAFLLLVLFTWLLSSSNRNLRDRVSKAMIEILKYHFNLCEILLDQFKEVNDPYIIQRLYGNIFGAVMKREKDYKKEFAELVSWIYKELFLKEYVYPDILLRDYARLIIERFAYEYPVECAGINLQKVRPPYKSKQIPQVEKIDYGNKKYHSDGMWRLLHSMKFDMRVKGVGLYGDFGRYKFQSALKHFIGVDIENVYYYSLKYIIEELGYTEKYFGEYDSKRANFDRHHVRKIERIGKKYQWIAMYNNLARVSDYHNVQGWDWNNTAGTAYTGPWNPYVRDFDPTLNMQIKTFDHVPQIEIQQYEEKFLPFNAQMEAIDSWLVEKAKIFQDFPDCFIRKDESGREWVSMWAHREKEIAPLNEENSFWGSSYGEQHVWTISAMYINVSGKTITCKQLEAENFINTNDQDLNNSYTLFNREYIWSPGYQAELNVNEENAVQTVPAVINTSWAGEYDASNDEATSFMIPGEDIIRKMNLHQKKVDGFYYYGDEIAAFDLSLVNSECKEFVIRRDILDEYIKKSKAKLFWTVVGEKQYFLGDNDQRWSRWEGYFIYGKKQIVGEVNSVR